MDCPAASAPSYHNPTFSTAIVLFIVFVFGRVRGLLDRESIRESVLESAGTVGTIYLILLGAELLKIFMSHAGVPQAAARAHECLCHL